MFWLYIDQSTYSRLVTEWVWVVFHRRLSAMLRRCHREQPTSKPAPLSRALSRITSSLLDIARALVLHRKEGMFPGKPWFPLPLPPHFTGISHSWLSFREKNVDTRFWESPLTRCAFAKRQKIPHSLQLICNGKMSSLLGCTLLAKKYQFSHWAPMNGKLNWLWRETKLNSCALFLCRTWISKWNCFLFSLYKSIAPIRLASKFFAEISSTYTERIKECSIFQTENVKQF